VIDKLPFRHKAASAASAAAEGRHPSERIVETRLVVVGDVELGRNRVVVCIVDPERVFAEGMNESEESM